MLCQWKRLSIYWYLILTLWDNASSYSKIVVGCLVWSSLPDSNLSLECWWIPPREHEDVYMREREKCLKKNKRILFSHICMQDCETKFSLHQKFRIFNENFLKILSTSFLKFLEILKLQKIWLIFKFFHTWIKFSSNFP